MRKYIIVLALVLLLPSIVSAATTVFENPYPVGLKILDQTYISNYIMWDFEPVNDTRFFANFTMDYDLYKDVKSVFSTKCTHVKWQDFANTYFDDPDDLEDPNGVVICEHIKNLWQLPRVSDNMTFTDIDFNMDSGSGTFYIDLNAPVENLTALFGFGTTTVATGNAGDQTYIASWLKQAVYDPVNDRFHVFYIDSGSDIHSASAPINDLTSWTDGEDVVAGTYDYEDFSVVVDTDGSTVYAHVVYTDGDSRDITYDRCTLKGTDDFIDCSLTDETIYYSGASADDMFNPMVDINSTDCLVVFWSFEDDSEATGFEYEVAYMVEGGTCGDGDWDYDDAGDTEYSSIDFQPSLTYYDITKGIYRYSDEDFRFFWHSVPASYNPNNMFIYSVNLDESSQTIGTIANMETAVEGSVQTAVWMDWAGLVWDDNAALFACDDGTVDLDIYTLDTKTDTTPSQSDTGGNVQTSTASASAKVTAGVDVNGTNGDDLWVFYQDDTDTNDIRVVNSSNGGTNWNDSFLLADEAVTNAEYMTNAFDNNCTFLVRWIDGADVEVESYQTESCSVTSPPADSCTYDTGDWYIDCSDYCEITDVTYMDTNLLECTGTGEVYVNAEVELGDFVIGEGCKVVFGSSGKFEFVKEVV